MISNVLHCNQNILRSDFGEIRLDKFQNDLMTVGIVNALNA